MLSPTRTNLVQASCIVVSANQCFSNPANPSLGITPGYGAKYEGVPFVSLEGGFAFGNNQSGNFSQTGNLYQVLDTYTRIVGRHTLKFGADIRNQRLHQLYFYNISMNLEFRTEIFNVFNHTQFFNPDGNITDGTSFGQVSRARDPRLIQLAVRLTF